MKLRFPRWTVSIWLQWRFFLGTLMVAPLYWLAFQLPICRDWPLWFKIGMTVGAMWRGLLSAAAVGGGVGTLLYHNSETVRDGAGWIVENLMNGLNSLSNDLAQVNKWIGSLPHHPVGGQVVP